MFRDLTPNVRLLILINVGMFLAKSFLPDEYLSLHYFGAKDFYPFQLVTYMFVHGSFFHLLGNMFGLYMFGSLLERIWGAQRFLFFYFFCGIGAGLLYVGIQHFVDFADVRRATEVVLSNPSSFNLMDYAQHYAVIGSPQGIALNIEWVHANYAEFINRSILGGASGSIFGILMAFGYLFPNSEMFLFPLPIPIKAKYFVSFYGLYELYQGIQQYEGDNVAHFAHIGGMIFAVILLKFWGTKRNNFY
jgi:membrane associated rhomboid family serine protease